MNVLPLLHVTKKQTEAARAENQTMPATEGLAPGWTTVTLHWSDIDVVVDGILDAMVSAMSYPDHDREAALDLAEEAVFLNKAARLAQAAQDATKPST